MIFAEEKAYQPVLYLFGIALFGIVVLTVVLAIFFSRKPPRGD